MMTSAVYFHVTPATNLNSILEDGLRPRIGARSAELGETTEAVYLFKSLDDVEDALTNWLGDCFDEDEVLALLSVQGTGLQFLESSAAYECVVPHPIIPSALHILCHDLDDESTLIQIRHRSNIP